MDFCHSPPPSSLVPPQRCSYSSRPGPLLPVYGLYPLGGRDWASPAHRLPVCTVGSGMDGAIGNEMPYRLIKKPKDRTRIDSRARGELCTCLCVCVYRASACTCTHTHVPLPCAVTLASPSSRGKGWRLDLEEGVSCQERGWGGVGLFQK